MAFGVGKRVVAEASQRAADPAPVSLRKCCAATPRLGIASAGTTATRASTRPRAERCEPNHARDGNDNQRRENANQSLGMPRPVLWRVPLLLDRDEGSGQTADFVAAGESSPALPLRPATASERRSASRSDCRGRGRSEIDGSLTRLRALREGRWRLSIYWERS